MGIGDWLQHVVSGWSTPDRTVSSESLAQTVYNALMTDLRTFRLEAVLSEITYKKEDLSSALERAYTLVLDAAWADGRLDRSEHDFAYVAAGKLEISDARADALNARYAKLQFGRVLTSAFEDGVIDDSELANLRHIADSRAATVEQFARDFFRSEGKALLQKLFLDTISDGVLSGQEWERLVRASELLGLKRDDLLDAIGPHSDAFLEQVLTDVKADGQFSEGEESTLDWLLRTLPLSKARRQYIESEMARLREYREFDNGKLPRVDAPLGLGLKAAEVVHFCKPGAWEVLKRLKSGDSIESHRGQVVVTDTRLVFASSSRSHTIGFRKIVSHRPRSVGFEIQVEGKAAATLVLGQAAERGYRIFRAAVAMANQTLVARVDGLPARHIPRDVRQRVYQQYGGRCAECKAQDYLEYDHIIPFAKGGGNTEKNVQLLCRRCNLRKSDAI